VAFLLGCRSGTKVSRYERFARVPTLRTALAYEAIFHKPLRELFAGLYQEIEKETERRAQRLAARLSKKQLPASGVSRSVTASRKARLSPAEPKRQA